MNWDLSGIQYNGIFHALISYPVLNDVSLSAVRSDHQDLLDHLFIHICTADEKPAPMPFTLNKIYCNGNYYMHWNSGSNIMNVLSNLHIQSFFCLIGHHAWVPWWVPYEFNVCGLYIGYVLNYPLCF